jgi:hypothetical protein
MSQPAETLWRNLGRVLSRSLRHCYQFADKLEPPTLQKPSSPGAITPAPQAALPIGYDTKGTVTATAHGGSRAGLRFVPMINVYYASSGAKCICFHNEELPEGSPLRLVATFYNNEVGKAWSYLHKLSNPLSCEALSTTAPPQLDASTAVQGRAGSD